MGSASRSRIAKLLMGDTTPEVLARAGIPLFLSQ
jgi:nucleotide-binding universal stress UspA family protein